MPRAEGPWWVSAGDGESRDVAGSVGSGCGCGCGWRAWRARDAVWSRGAADRDASRAGSGRAADTWKVNSFPAGPWE